MTKSPNSPASKFKHVLPGQHVYEGVLFFGYSPPEILDAVKHFHVRYDDVIIVTYPKAGTTWMQEITWLLMNDGNFEIAMKIPVYMRSPFLEFKDTTLNEIGLEIASAAPSPRIIKTHLPLKLMPHQIHDKNSKIILFFRNPKDVCVSYYNFYKSSSSFGNFQGYWSEFLEMFKEGHGNLYLLSQMFYSLHSTKPGLNCRDHVLPMQLDPSLGLPSLLQMKVDHGSWFDFTKSWWPLRKQPNVKLVYFEDMKQNPFAEIKMLAEFLGKSHIDDSVLSTIAAHCSFEKMKDNPMTNHLDVYSIDSSISPLLRKGLVGDWRNQFTVKQNEDFDKLYCDKLGHLNIPFKYTLDY